MACFLAIPFLSNTNTGFTFFLITVALYLILFLWTLRTTARPRLRRAFLSGLVVATMLLLTGVHAMLSNRIELQVAGARLMAALVYEKAHPLREEQTMASREQFGWLRQFDTSPQYFERLREALDRAHPTGHEPGDPGYWAPWSLASRPLWTQIGALTPEEDVEAKAEEAWRRSHWVQSAAEKLLYVPTSITLSIAAVAPGALIAAGSYLSFPFKLALGVGFGIALGAWIVKKWP